MQGAGALLNKAKDAVSGSGNTAGESQTLAAGRMSQRCDYQVMITSGTSGCLFVELLCKLVECMHPWATFLVAEAMFLSTIT